MLRDQVGWYLGAIVSLLVILATVQGLRKDRRDKLNAAKSELNDAKTTAFQDGRNSRDDEVALLRSQRDDARRDRDQAQYDLDLLNGQIRAVQINRLGPQVQFPSPRPRPRPGDD